ncbi:MAG: hypothetical protein JSS64_12385 [Bacteroidetes bacterium]|nr:hypothetical protein [Bacteroidota bacterium]
MTRLTHNRIRDIQQQMDNMQQQSERNQPKAAPKAKSGDYIEYEEVK